MSQLYTRSPKNAIPNFKNLFPLVCHYKKINK
nr:MAG TPA: hypothetical protein [Bacteriophage sp.]